MTVNFNHRQALGCRALKDGHDIVRLPCNIHWRPFAFVVGNSVDLPRQQAMAPVTVAAAAEHDCDRLSTIVGKKKAPKVSVLIARESERYRNSHFSNSRSSQSSIRRTCVPR